MSNALSVLLVEFEDLRNVGLPGLPKFEEIRIIHGEGVYAKAQVTQADKMGRAYCGTCRATRLAALYLTERYVLEAALGLPGIVVAELHLSLQNKKGPAPTLISICRFMPPCHPFGRCLS
jgi:hypothetical protein